MRSFVVIASFVSLAAAQSFATGGQGRFFCGSTAPDQSQCADNVIASTVIPGCGPQAGKTVDGNGFKNYGPIPTGAQCVAASAGGGYFCGLDGATCTSDDNCDNGSCSGGICIGGLGSSCTVDSDCSGSIYCLNPNQESTGSPVCGFSDTTDGTGALCDDGCNAGNFLCLSGVCDGNTGSCFPTLAGASQRAKSRRRTLAIRGSRCPASHSACPVVNSKVGFECIDTSSNLEQCGACASAGGVDCTALPGVEAVGCVAGRCEIWSCDSASIWDAASASCVPSLSV